MNAVVGWLLSVSWGGVCMCALTLWFALGAVGLMWSESNHSERYGHGRR